MRALSISSALLVLLLIARQAASVCVDKCGNRTIPYPFFIRNDEQQRRHHICQGRELAFGLDCASGGTLVLELQSARYKVLNFSSRSNVIIIDPDVSGGESERSCRKSGFNLTTANFALSFDNFLALYRCGGNESGCPNNCVNSRTAQWLRSAPLRHSCGEPNCCYDMQFASSQMLRGFDIHALGCATFSSWVITFKEAQSQVVWDASYGLGLEWSLTGSCPSQASSATSTSTARKHAAAADAPSYCAENAHCVNGTLQGYICVCDDSFEGDPYHTGCKRAGKASQTPRQKGVKGPVLLAAILAGATVLAAVVIALALLLRRKQQRFNTRNNSRTCVRDAKQLSKLLTKCGSCRTKLFSYKELEKATKGFSPSQMLGHGGHGTVYAGKLGDGQEVAVKRINHVSIRGIEQVMNEVKVLLSVNHPNLVQLLGCCLEVYDPLLVYEYVPNGTLAEHLQRKRGEGLDWYARITIAVDAAQALAYLHTVNPPVYHRDVKSTNILLDFDYTTKVGDFGLSKLVLTEDSHISTAPQGTPGYLDPEYHQNFQLSDKSDVYSFGVVLVEIITAMKVVDFTRDKREVNLAALAVGKIASDSLDQIIDPFLLADSNPVIRCMIQRVAELAFRCLAYEKDARPSMVEVLEELESIKSACMLSPGANSPIRDIKIDESLLIR